jgi:hypothetical protein
VEYATYENADKFGVLPLDTTVKRGEAIFPRIDVEKEIDELNAIIKNNEPQEEPAVELAPHKDEIVFDDFEKVEMRVGKVLACLVTFSISSSRTSPIGSVTIPWVSKERTCLPAMPT